MSPELKRRLLDRATAPYRPTGTFHYRWGRGKLSGDPIFAAILEERLFPDGARVTDLGCGRGLLAAWCLAAEAMAAEGQWPAEFAAPRGLHFSGCELMGREAEVGMRALTPLYPGRVALCGGDMRAAPLEGFNVIAILDVLHYVDYADQEVLLDRIRAALPPGGRFLTRIGNARGGLRFAMSQLVDRGISFVQGHRLPRLWCRPLEEWVALLEARGFQVRTRSMNGANPFANVMLVADLPHAGQSPAIG
jgi:SAM-dependent methyltransferase